LVRPKPRQTDFGGTRHWRRLGKKIHRVELTVAHKFVSRTVKIIRAGFRNHVNHGARCLTDLGGITVGLYLKFGDGFDARPYAGAPDRLFIVV
jgi:hypothetical protein